MSDALLGRTLVGIARASIGSAFGRAGRGPADDAHPALGSSGATFVTLIRDGVLRGCIGSLVPRRALRQDVRANALAAAFGDPRFPPLAAVEFDVTTVEVSLLGASEPLRHTGEAQVLAQLAPGEDGVIIEYGRHRATFLPQVWDVLPEPRAFLAALKRKAGLPADFWHAEMNVRRYPVIKFIEGELLSVEMTG